MERKPLGQDGEVFIYFLLNDATKQYMAWNAGSVILSMAQYSWTIEPAPTQGYFLYVKHIMLNVIFH